MWCCNVLWANSQQSTTICPQFSEHCMSYLIYKTGPLVPFKLVQALVFAMFILVLLNNCSLYEANDYSIAELVHFQFLKMNSASILIFGEMENKLGWQCSTHFCHVRREFSWVPVWTWQKTELVLIYVGPYIIWVQKWLYIGTAVFVFILGYFLWCHNVHKFGSYICNECSFMMNLSLMSPHHAQVTSRGNVLHPKKCCLGQTLCLLLCPHLLLLLISLAI